MILFGKYNYDFRICNFIPERIFDNKTMKYQRK